jgi:hypothetical protein
MELSVQGPALLGGWAGFYMSRPRGQRQVLHNGAHCVRCRQVRQPAPSCHVAAQLIAKSQILGCGSSPTQYALDRADELQGWLGYSLLALVLLTLWLETRVTLRPWFKRLLRLAGPLFLASLMVPLWLFFIVTR